MLSRISSLLCGGFLFGLLSPLATAQAPIVGKPEIFTCQKIAVMAVPRLIEALKSPNEQVRADAIATLGAMGATAKPAAPALVELAVNTRGHAATLQALAKIDDDATRMALRKLLAGGQNRCRCGFPFTEVVAAAGEPMAPYLVALLAEPETSASAERVLVRIGEPAVPHLIRDLEDRNVTARQAACRSLAQIGPKAKSAAPALEKRLAIEKDATRLWVAQALYMVTGSHPGAVDVLHDAVRSGDKAQRALALHCLQEARCDAKELIPTMVSLLSDDQYSYNAGSVLVNIGRDSTPAIIAALAKSDADQSRLLFALRRLGANGSTAIPVVIKMLNGNDLKLAMQAADSFPSFGPDAKQAIPHLLAALKSDDLSLRRISAASLVQIDPQQIPNAIEPLLEVVRKGKQDEQRQALYLLQNFRAGSKPAVPALIALLKTQKLALRVAIANALNFIDPSQIEAAMPTLIEAIDSNENRGETQSSAMQLLGQLGPRAKGAQTPLKKALTESLRKHDENVYPEDFVDCLMQINPALDLLPILIEGLNSTDKQRRVEARHLVSRRIGVRAVPALETALANGQLRSTPEVVALLKQLRPRTPAVTQ